jgi:flavin-dependent dehydrogenase
MSATDDRVIIAGGGIGGLAAALTLHQIGVPCVVFEAVADMRPLGVGINLQPNAVRELYDLGITKDDLDRVGLHTFCRSLTLGAIFAKGSYETRYVTKIGEADGSTRTAAKRQIPFLVQRLGLNRRQFSTSRCSS